MTTFLLTAAPAPPVPAIRLHVLPTVLVLGVICALLGILQLAWRSNRRTYLLLGIGLALTGVAFLAWAGKGVSVDAEGLLATSLIEAVPLTLGALSGVLCERSGVINIAIEGQFLISAFFGAMIGSLTHNLWAGLFAGAVAGGMIGVILAVFAITYAADQIIVGVVLDAFALGLTSFFLQSLLVPQQATLNSPAVFSPIPIPLLDRIPVIGPLLFNQNIFVYLTIGILVAVQIGLFHTRWGLRVRAVGEHPRAADTVGINVPRLRYGNVILGRDRRGHRRRFLHDRVDGAVRAQHDRRTRIHRPGRDDFRAMAPLGRARRRLAVRILRRAAVHSLGAERPDTVALSLDVPLSRDHPRGGRSRRARRISGRRRAALFARMIALRGIRHAAEWTFPDPMPLPACRPYSASPEAPSMRASTRVVRTAACALFRPVTMRDDFSTDRGGIYH